MEINGYNASAPSKTHDINHVPKFPTLDMLKDNGELPQLIESVPSKEEFIDHTLLAPEYLRDSNNLIMDLMDQQVVFQKPLVASSAGYNEKEQALHSELQFQNAIFQFVNKHGQMQCAVADDGVALEATNVTDSNHSFNNKLQASFITLNGNFLADPSTNKVFQCNALGEENSHNQFAPLINASLDGICEITQQHKQSVSELGLIEEEVLNNSSLMPETDLLCSLSDARKVLPHKKRISIKLKDTENNSDYSLTPVEIKGKEEQHRMEVRVLQFSCEICGHSSSSQIEFFAHLKHHYEPESPGALLPVIKTAQRDVVSEKIFIDNACLQNKKFGHETTGQVFPDVHINFEDFHQVDDSVVNAINQANVHDDMKILNSNSIDKCIRFVEQNCVEPPKIISSEEIEFSDTEDMLEGIRNVVDKVSIEDTCDAVDMISSNTLRTPWFPNSNFSGISFSSKLIGNNDFCATANNELPLTKTSLSPVQGEFRNITKSESIPDLMDDGNKYEYPASNTVEHNIDFVKVINKPIIAVCASSDSNKSHTSLKKTPESEQDADDKIIDAEETQSPFICSYCSREFNSNNALKYHTRTHTGIRPHQCEICGRSFFAHGALKSHMRTHTGDKPFGCEHCHRQFRQMGDLKYHVASIHNDVKCHQCEFCGKAFSRKYSLVLHRRIHTSERDYKCDFCPKSFRASIYLQNHRKIHTGEKPYQCEVCSKKFRMSGDLRRHVRTHKRKEAKVENEESA